jgi:hypothetical protein
MNLSPVAVNGRFHAADPGPIAKPDDPLVAYQGWAPPVRRTATRPTPSLTTRAT